MLQGAKAMARYNIIAVSNSPTALMRQSFLGVYFSRNFVTTDPETWNFVTTDPETWKFVTTDPETWNFVTTDPAT